MSARRWAIDVISETRSVEVAEHIVYSVVAEARRQAIEEALELAEGVGEDAHPRYAATLIRGLL